MRPVAEWLADLWHGRLPMSRVFWLYAVCYGTLLNLLTTIASYALVAGKHPDWLALAIHFLATPYNLLMIVSVWKGARRYQGRQIWPALARPLIIVWAIAATLI